MSALAGIPFYIIHQHYLVTQRLEKQKSKNIRAGLALAASCWPACSSIAPQCRGCVCCLRTWTKKGGEEEEIKKRGVWAGILCMRLRWSKEGHCGDY
jgi:hypothetical protein